MPRFRILSLILVALVGAPGVANSQATDSLGDDPLQVPSDNTSFGGASAEFLQFGAGARGMALGGAFSTIVDDVSSVYYNPAGLTAMTETQAHLTVMPYFADTDYYWTGLAFPMADGDFGFGVFLGHFGFGDQPIFTEQDETGESGEFYGVSQTVAGLSFAHAFIDRFSAGGTVKFISDDLATGALAGATARTVAFDFGVNFHSELGDRPIALSFVVQNLGGSLRHQGDALRFRDVNGSQGEEQSTPDQRVDPIFAEIVTDGFPLPRLFRAGVSYDVVSSENSRLSLMGEFVEANNTKPSFDFAGEYEWQSDVSPIGASLRASFAPQLDNDDLGGLEADNEGLDGLGLGGGIFYRVGEQYRIQFDYAFRHYGVLGSADAFSVTFGWE